MGINRCHRLARPTLKKDGVSWTFGQSAACRFPSSAASTIQKYRSKGRTKLARKMPPISIFEESVITVLEETRSVAATARQLHMPLRDVQRVAMMAFGLGRL